MKLCWYFFEGGMVTLEKGITSTILVDNFSWRHSNDFAVKISNEPVMLRTGFGFRQAEQQDIVETTPRFLFH